MTPLRKLFNLILECTEDEGSEDPIVTVRFGSVVLTFKGNFKMDVKTTEGPFQVVVSDFVDAGGQPAATPTETPTYASSDTTIATVDASGVVTLTKTAGTTNVTATYASFVVTGTLNVASDGGTGGGNPAVSATMTFVPVA